MREPYDMKLADGVVLSLKYSFKAIRFFEKVTGQHFFGDSAQGRIGADYLSAGLAAGLLWKNPHIKTDDLDAAIEKHMLAGGDLPTLIEGLMEALKKGGVLKSETESGSEANAPRPTTPAIVTGP